MRGGVVTDTLSPASGMGNIGSCGSMMAVADKDAHLGMLIWTGNSTTPSGGTDNTYDFVLPADYKPAYQANTPLRNGAQGTGLQVRTDGKARLTVTSNWTSATLTYILE